MSETRGHQDWEAGPRRFSLATEPAGGHTGSPPVELFAAETLSDWPETVLVYTVHVPYPYLHSTGLYLRRSPVNGAFRFFAYAHTKIGRNAGSDANALDLDADIAEAFRRLFQAAGRSASPTMEHVGRDGAWISAGIFVPEPIRFKAWTPGASSLPGQFHGLMRRAINAALVKDNKVFGDVEFVHELGRLAEAFEALGPI